MRKYTHKAVQVARKHISYVRAHILICFSIFFQFKLSVWIENKLN